MENKIKELRKEHKITQDELAAAVGVTRQTIISLENGKYNASLQLAHKISVFFGLKMLRDEEAIRWTGRGCSPILKNLLQLDRETDTPYRLRIPFLAGVTAADGYLHELEIFCRQLQRADGIDFLPSNPDAGAKYASCGKVFDPGYDPLEKATLPGWFSPGIPFRLFQAGEVE